MRQNPTPQPKLCYPVYNFDAEYYMKRNYLFHASTEAKANAFARAFNESGLTPNGCYLASERPLPPHAKLDNYQGWTFDFEYGYHTAIHDNYDAEWGGEEDGWIDNGLKTSARTLSGLLLEIEELKETAYEGADEL